MNKEYLDDLEKLYQESKSLDPQMAEIARLDSERREKLRQERNKRWEQMCDDIIALSKYSGRMDTGVPVYKDPEKQTIGFDVYDGDIKMVSLLHEDEHGKKYDMSKVDTYFFNIARNIPYKNSAPASLTSFVDRLDILADNWEDILPVLKDDIAKRLEFDIQTKKKIIEEAEYV